MPDGLASIAKVMSAPLLLTTSWDDGDPADLRLAEVLADVGVHGTFYLCRSYDGRPRLTDAEIRELASMPHVEVGAHSLTHPDLRALRGARLRDEVEGSRTWLEDLLGREVRTFCYPAGKHNSRAVAAARAAGFSYARTTKSTTTDLPRDPFRAGTSLQLYPHGRLVQLRHAVKERDVSGARRILGMRGWSTVPASQAANLVDHARQATRPQLLHVWGHSWEIEETQMWPSLKETLTLLKEACSRSIVNGDVPSA